MYCCDCCVASQVTNTKRRGEGNPVVQEIEKDTMETWGVDLHRILEQL